MVGFIKSIRQSVYLKCMLLAYILTLCVLGFHLLTEMGLDKSSLIFNKTVAKSAHTHESSSILTDGKTTSGRSIIDIIGEGRVTSQCPNTVFPEKRFRLQTWQKVGPTNSTLVFSAYHDEKNTRWIKIVGLSVKLPEQHFCQFWYIEKESKVSEMKTSKASIRKLHGSPPKYTSCFITCALPDNRTPNAVSLVSGDGCKEADNVLLVRNIPIQNYTRNFTVCLCPLNFRYGRAYEFIEWIELNRILGADHFVVYNYSSAVNIVSVLDHYSKLGVVEVLQWPLPIGVNKWPPTQDSVDVHYFAQMASLNDCLLRSKGASKYVVNLDVDEFIIPHANNSFSWHDIIAPLPSSGAYLFRNSFFRKEWSIKNLDFTGKQMAEKYNLVTLLKAERETEILKPRQRSKYIAKTSAVELIVTHDITSMNGGQKILTVSPDVALLHHYRNWEKYNGLEKRVTDKTVIEKFSKKIIERVMSIWSELQNVEMDIPI